MMKNTYPNLEAEMARQGLRRKDLAEVLDVRTATIYDKLNGKFPFTLNEAMRIRDSLFPNLTIDYLFSSETLTA
mgnify:CR=1 FL=1